MGNCHTNNINNNIHTLTSMLIKKYNNYIIFADNNCIKIKNKKTIYIIDFNILNELFEIYIINRNNVVYSHKKIKSIYKWIKKNII